MKLQYTVIMAFWGLLVLSQQALGELGEVVMMKASFNERNYTTTYDEGMIRIVNVLRTLNKTVVKKNQNEWMNLTQQEFGSFDAVIIFQPLPVCRILFPVGYNPFANSQAWGAAINGNVIISFSGEDHDEIGKDLRREGIAFSLAAEVETTGAYISLGETYSCDMRGYLTIDWLDQAFHVPTNTSEEGSSTTTITSGGFVIGPQSVRNPCQPVIKDDPNRLHSLSNQSLESMETPTLFHSWSTSGSENFSVYAGCESHGRTGASILLNEVPPRPPPSLKRSKNSKKSKKSKQRKQSKHPKAN